MRNLILARIEEADPKLYEELVELRSTNPQAYRKQLRHWVQYYPIPKPQKVMANRGAKYKGLQFDTLDVIDQPFQILRNAIRAGNLDDHLDTLERMEREGRNRPVVFQFIDERRVAIVTDDPAPTLPRAPTDWRKGDA